MFCYPSRFFTGLCLVMLGGPLSEISRCEAGWPWKNRSSRTSAPVTTSPRAKDQVAASPMLGTFQPTPVITVRGNGVIGGGYSPIGLYGENNAMTLFGPISSLRETAAPVNTVVRGYNGVGNLVEGTSYSTPFQPDLSPVKYPTRVSNYSAPRGPGIPPRTGNGIMWVDQN